METLSFLCLLKKKKSPNESSEEDGIYVSPKGDYSTLSLVNEPFGGF